MPAPQPLTANPALYRNASNGNGIEMAQIVESFGWPHFAFLFSLVFVLLFRAQISGLLSRITSIDKSGIKAQAAPEAQREEKKKEAVQELLLAIGNSIVLQDIESRIRQHLESLNMETGGDTAKVLIKHLAATKLLLEFEQIHNLIFGSQIFLLKKLNEVAGQGKSDDIVTAHFENVKALFPDAFSDWTLEQYLSFLHARLLILHTDDVYHITNLGVEYLTWMVRNGRREDNPL